MIKDNVILAWAGFVLLVSLYIYAIAPLPTPWCEYIAQTQGDLGN